MRIGIALPQMAPGYGPTTTVDWARAAEEAGFASISAGERVTFSNPEMVASLGAAAAVTEEIGIFANLWVLPAQQVAMVAQQIGTLDQLSSGRLTAAVGVGAREHDYRALGASMSGRYTRMDEQVAELRRLLAGEPPFPGADPVGPAPVQPGGPPILAGASGPKALARAARWADGVSGFSIAGDADEIARTNRMTLAAWEDAGRPRPQLLSGCFVALGVPEPERTLREFAARYLAFLGPELADAMADTVRASSQEALAEILRGAEEAGCDEFVLVPGSTDLRLLEAAAELLQR